MLRSGESIPSQQRTWSSRWGCRIEAITKEKRRAVKVIDPIAGELQFDHGWCRQFEVEFLGATQFAVLCFSGDPHVPLEGAQRSAYAHFFADRERLLCDASTALLRHCLSIRLEIQERASNEQARGVAAEMSDELHLRELVELKEIFFPESFGSASRVFGLILDCDWDPSLGIGIRFEDEALVEIGPQDIVLS